MLRVCAAQLVRRNHRRRHMTSPEAVEQHYSGRGLAERIFATLAAEGHDTCLLYTSDAADDW